MKNMIITHFTKKFKIEVNENEICLKFSKLPQLKTTKELDDFIAYLINLGEAIVDYQPINSDKAKNTKNSLMVYFL